MVTHKTAARKITLLNLLAGAGYLLLVGQWALLLAMYLPTFFDSSIGKTLFPKGELPPQLRQQPQASPHTPSGFIMVLAIGASVLLVAFVVYTIVMHYIPTTARKSSEIVQVAARKAAPILTHRSVEALPPQKRRQITARMLRWTQIVLTIIPVAIVLVISMQRQTLLSQLAVFLQAVVAVLVIALFSSHNMLAKYWRLKPEETL